LYKKKKRNKLFYDKKNNYIKREIKLFHKEIKLFY